MLRLFKKNKKTVFNRLYQSYSKPLFLLVLRYVASQFDAEEVLQRGFIKIYEALDNFKFENEKATIGWLNQIMVNESLLFLREQKRLTLANDNEFQNLSILEIPDIENTLELESCLKVIRNLPDGYRTVFNLYVIEGYSHKEIAKELNISESASRSQLTRARNTLKTQLKSHNYAAKYVG
ncbi:sigma-70 family RNA polymerase sigma factor [Marinifilum sp. N1E240]|uniref:RNA polymerase sigma factor n=1 Tax=Marinifilum sp. N1E240 TaxID=2608082 RepID=UPI00128C5DEE|nr:sigma-70 family RNA polymerase sigma factor [Marinifilum sp. N1E240]MPQ48199.1 sigma-70 family RNA polymerase sigma factor [Marinifilum sp. N1E240]